MDYAERAGKVTSFSFVVSDWALSGEKSDYFGGTPVYASANAFNVSGQKDIHAFGQIAAELYLPQSGNLTKIKMVFLFNDLVLLK